MNCLIIGYGSIGKRHANILQGLNHTVHVVTRRNLGDFTCHGTICEALENKTFDYVVISNETAKHLDSFTELRELGYLGKTLIEKPLFHKTPVLKEFDSTNTFVAYQFRFHPILLEILLLTNAKKILTINTYVGQYLPDWRPGTDYSKSYSASRQAGGGVLRDLSHELDYITWIGGPWKRVAGMGGKFSNLSVDSDDVFGLMLETEKCPVVIVQLSYLDRFPRREIIINLEDMTIRADLINNLLEIDGNRSKFDVEKNQPYRDMHRAVLADNHRNTCSFKEGLQILKLIECAKAAGKNRTWVYQ